MYYLCRYEQRGIHGDTSVHHAYHAISINEESITKLNQTMSERKERIYPKGLVTFAPHENAPDFVIGNLVIVPEELIDWMETDGLMHVTSYNGKRQVKLQILAGKERGRPSLPIDNPPKHVGGTDFKKKDDLPF